VLALRQQLNRQLDDRARAKAAHQWTDTGYVFTPEDSQPFHPDHITRDFAKLVDGAPVKSIQFRDLRHTHASHLLLVNVPATVVSERLGHVTIGFTLNVYSHVLPRMQEEAADRTEANGGAGAGARTRTGVKPSGF